MTTAGGQGLLPPAGFFMNEGDVMEGWLYLLAFLVALAIMLGGE